MPNTRVEAALRGIGDGGRLEQLASDLLRQEGYEVEPTDTRGPDNGRDSLLNQEGEQGILHCSVAENWETKANDDAESADNRPEDFDFFIFATTQNPAGVMRDRVEEEIEEEYGWRVRIYDFERLRNRLVGDTENHYLAREHLSVDPGHAFDDVSSRVNDKYESFIERLHDREAPYSKIRDELPMAVIHIIPGEALNENHDRIGSDLPEPPSFASRTSITENFGDFVITSNRGRLDDDPYHHYTCFHIEGWMEAVSTRLEVARGDVPRLVYAFDPFVVEFIEQALNCYEELNILPPFFVFITLIDAEDYTMSRPRGISGPPRLREFATDELRLNRVTIESFDDHIPTALRRSFYELWERAGWSVGSIHYNEEENEATAEVNYEWDPYDS